MSKHEPNLVTLASRLLLRLPDLNHCEALVIGLGLLGHQVARVLAVSGLDRLSLYDPAKVQPEDAQPLSGYWPCDVGEPRARRTALLCHLLSPELKMRARSVAWSGAFKPRHPGNRLAIFLCVEGLAERRRVWPWLRSLGSFLVDGRLEARRIRVLATGRPDQDSYYPSTLDEDVAAAGPGPAIGAAEAANMMLHRWICWLRRLPLIRDQRLDLSDWRLQEPVSREEP